MILKTFLPPLCTILLVHGYAFDVRTKPWLSFQLLKVAVCHALNCAVYQIRTNLALKIMYTQL